MFEFTSRLKTLTIVLMLIGAVSIGFSFFSGGGHEDGHHEDGEHTEHTTDDHAHDDAGAHAEEASGHTNQSHELKEEALEDAQEAHGHGSVKLRPEPLPEYDYHRTATQAFPENNSQYQNSLIKVEQTHHQAQNEPWVNLTVNNFFFLAVAIGALFFMAVQYAAQVGWSVVVLRIMEAMSAYLIIPLLIMLGIVLVAIYGDSNHMWHWMQDGIMDPNSTHYDEVIAGKEFYLNKPFFLIRTILYVIIWAGGAMLLRRMSLKMNDDSVDGAKNYKRMRTFSIIFLVLYGFTSVTSAWDWIMSIDTHWFSTLFGWYTFAGCFISALTVMTLLAIFLRDKGYLNTFNDSHIHDLAKFMFAFSIFWTYLWTAQYLLQWYSQMPEEVTYFMVRFREYKALYLAMVAINFLFPILVLMSRDSKRNKGFIIFAGIMMIIGHWLDFFMLFTPGAVGATWSIGLVQIGTFLGFAGLFLFVVFTAMSKRSFVPKNHPMLQESKYFHI